MPPSGSPDPIARRLVGLLLSKADLVNKALAQAGDKGFSIDAVGVVLVGQESGIEAHPNTALVQTRDTFWGFCAWLGLELPPPVPGWVPVAVLDHGQGTLAWFGPGVLQASEGTLN